MDPVSELENALGAELLRARLLGRGAPTIAERYAVESVLGRGASGIVLAATDVRLNRPVALKIRLVAGDSGALDEARALARLDHPNVVRVHDVDIVRIRFGTYDREAWIVTMPRVEGRTMRAYLLEQERTVPEIVRVVADVGRGLAAAHAARIVHRDVKPDNVLVREDGIAQVLDFGFAVQTAPAQSELGGVRGSAGTDPYMAPEARLGRTSRASDQFSLGITLVEALTGEPRPAGTRVPDGVPSVVWDVAKRATAPEPSERHADLGAMVEALTRSIDTTMPARRRGPMALAAVAVVAGLVGGAVWLGARTGRQDGTTPSPGASEGGARAASFDAGHAASSLAMGGTPDADVASGASDAGHAQAVDDGGMLARLDAGLDAGGRACRFTAGRWRFRTIDDSPASPQGLYELGVDVRGTTVRELALRRLEPMRDQLEVRSFTVGATCIVAIDAHAESRDYTFELTLDGRAVHGRFRTSRGANYAGRVVPAAE